MLHYSMIVLLLGVTDAITTNTSTCGINSNLTQCLDVSVSVQKYPYHASILAHECEIYPYSWWADGVIISDRYVLTTGDKFLPQNKCNYTVWVNSDTQDLVPHRAELQKIDNIVPETFLLRVDELIEFGPQASPIGLMKKKVESGERAILTKLIVGDKSRKVRKIFETNATVIDEQDCKNMLEQNGRFNRLSSGSFCTELPPEECSYPLGSPLVMAGQLIGLLNDDTLFRVKKPTQSTYKDNFRCFNMYLNITHHRAIIKEHIALRAQPLKL
ncbi:hypothetical protein QAD02_024030 [Eretmocerus hayati]|uniref:Uncharacterized protein n=1 Tax=Eretmocerus hayati TaxID=131215 RepID=A0ACC2PXV2_9HYME|nr:hypothetical protein QAD02_024030 [Eretmocerus hayati]